MFGVKETEVIQGVLEGGEGQVTVQAQGPVNEARDDDRTDKDQSLEEILSHLLVSLFPLLGLSGFAS